ncbi:MAG: shikimate dehydrogenase [Gammaproteobacteria bacterium]|nr:shikimate dehydrogenase [Gammaproteobacteria bacterium]
MSTTGEKPDRYAVVGHPIDHSRSPVIHQLFASQTGQNLVYEPIDAVAEAFETAVRGFAAAGGKGLNVTVPHKQAAYELCNELGPEAEKARAVNTISFRADGRIRGDNTDGIGFMRDLTDTLGEAVEDRRVLVLGAGGAARGILLPLVEASPAVLVLANRTIERAEEMIGELDSAENLRACTFTALADEPPFDIVVNATSAGLHGEEPPFPPACVGPDTLCYDLAYSLKDTPFVLWARANGAREAVQGWGMLVEQAAESFFIWRGVRPETAPILEHMRH